jgi:hypothetical protein
MSEPPFALPPKVPGPALPQGPEQVQRKSGHLEVGEEVRSVTRQESGSQEVLPPSSTRSSRIPPPPLHAAPLIPIATITLGEQELGGKSITVLQDLLQRLQNDRKACEAGQRSLGVGLDKAATLQRMDDNIRKIQEKIESLFESIAQDLEYGMGLRVIDGDLHTVGDAAPDAASMKKFLDLVSSMPKPIDAKTRGVILATMSTVFGSTWGAATLSNFPKELVAGLYQMFSELCPDTAASELVDKLTGNADLPAFVPALAQTFFSDVVALHAISQGDIAECSHLSELGLRQFAATVQKGASIPKGKMSIDMLLDLKEQQTVLLDVMKSRKGFEGEAAAITKDIERIDQEIAAKKERRRSMSAMPLGRSGGLFETGRARSVSAPAKMSGISEKQGAAASGLREKIQSLHTITKELAEKRTKIKQTNEGFVTVERETGLATYISKLVGRGTGYKADSRDAAIAFLGEMNTMLTELEGKTDAESIRCKEELLSMIIELTSSKWLKGVLHHHPAVGTSLKDLAQKAIPPSKIETWVALHEKLLGTDVGEEVCELINTFVQTRLTESISQEISTLEKELEKNPTDFSIIRGLYEKSKKLVAQTKAEGEDKGRLLAVNKRLQELYNQRGEALRDSISGRLTKIGIEKASQNTLYGLRHELNELMAGSFTEPLASQILELDKQCEKKLLELGKEIVERRRSLPTPADKDMESELSQEFNTCFRSLSLTGKQELKVLVDTLPEGVKKQYKADIAKEERRWALRMSISSQSLKDCISAGDRQALQREEKLYSDYMIAYEEVKRKTDEANEAKKAGRKVPYSAEELKLPVKPQTPLLDVFHIAEDFKHQSLSRVAPYFKNGIEIFETLDDLSTELVDKRQIYTCSELVKKLLIEQRGGGISPDQLHEKSSSIADKLSKAAGDPRVKADIMAEAAKLPEKTTALSSPTGMSAKAMIQEAITEGSKSSKYGEAVETVAQELYASSAMAFLNDPVSLVRLGNADRSFAQLGMLANHVTSFVRRDILDVPEGGEADLKAAQEKCRFWLQVAKKAREKGDLATVMGIQLALADASIQKIMKDEPKKGDYAQSMAELEALCSPLGNFKAMEVELAARMSHKPPLVCIPSPNIAKQWIDMSLQTNPPRIMADIRTSLCDKIETISGTLGRATQDEPLKTQTDLHSLIEGSQEISVDELGYSIARFLQTGFEERKVGDIEREIDNCIAQGNISQAKELIKKLPTFKLFNKAVNDQIDDIKQKVSLAEQVNDFVMRGDYAKAKQVLGQLPKSSQVGETRNKRMDILRAKVATAELEKKIDECLRTNDVQAARESLGQISEFKDLSQSSLTTIKSFLELKIAREEFTQIAAQIDDCLAKGDVSQAKILLGKIKTPAQFGEEVQKKVINFKLQIILGEEKTCSSEIDGCLETKDKEKAKELFKRIPSYLQYQIPATAKSAEQVLIFQKLEQLRQLAEISLT